MIVKFPVSIQATDSAQFAAMLKYMKKKKEGILNSFSSRLDKKNPTDPFTLIEPQPETRKWLRETSSLVERTEIINVDEN